MELIVRDGASIHYDLYGNKNYRTLIFLHGNMEDSSFFKKQVDFFRDRYQVLVIDTRGHGKSDWGSCDVVRGCKYDLRLLADDLLNLVVALDLTDYIVIGFSDGANIAMEFASGRPAGLEGLVLIGGNLRPWGLKLGTLLEIWKEYILSFFLTSGSGCSSSSSDGVNIRKKLGLMLFEPRIRSKRLADISVPTLVLTGDHDLIRRRENLKIGRRIRSSKVVFVEKADHYFIYINGDIANKMLEEWINSV